MPGTRTAPTVDGTPNYSELSVSVLDYTGDQRTDSYIIDAAASDAEVEALVAAIQAGSNSTIWRVTRSQVYNSIPSKSNALEEVWENAKDNVTILYKATQNQAIDFFVPSPINAMFVEGTENVNPANTTFTAITTAIDAVKAGYSAVSARLSHRKQIGKKINL